MRLFLDSSDIDEITEFKDFIGGVTTNPSLMKNVARKDRPELIKQICATVEGPVSVEVESEIYTEMMAEATNISKLDEKICVKLPCTFDGFRACRALFEKGIATNMTLCFSPAQALLAAECGATYVSPFIGRLDDCGESGIDLVSQIVAMNNANNYETMVIAASVRSVKHIVQAAHIGTDVATVPAKILRQCINHPLTDVGLEKFRKDIQQAK